MKITEEMLYKCAPKAEKLWLSSLPPDNQIPEHKFSRRFERKMRRFTANEKGSANCPADSRCDLNCSNP